MVLLLIAKFKKKLLLTNRNLFIKKLNHLIMKLYLKECWQIMEEKAREERDELAEKNKEQAAEIRKLKRELNKAKKSK